MFKRILGITTAATLRAAPMMMADCHQMRFQTPSRSFSFPSPAQTLQMAEAVTPKATAEQEEAEAKSKYLVLRNPTMALEYSRKNEVPVDKVSVNSGKKVLWECSTCHHEWRQDCMTRVALKSGCPKCAVKDVTMLSDLSGGILVEEWDRDHNDPFVVPEKLTSKASMTVWWKCSNCGGRFQEAMSKRVKQPLQGCTHCSLDQKVRNRCRDKRGMVLGEDGNSMRRKVAFNFQCTSCESVVKMSIDDVLSGVPCPGCELKAEQQAAQKENGSTVSPDAVAPEGSSEEVPAEAKKPLKPKKSKGEAKPVKKKMPTRADVKNAAKKKQAADRRKTVAAKKAEKVAQATAEKQEMETATEVQE